jgi:hypothetical protein
MKLGAQVSEDYMVAVFLKGELESPRWKLHVQIFCGFNLDLIRKPNLDVQEENWARANALCYRGYANNTGLFTNFPKDVVWRLATLSPLDVWNIRGVRPMEVDFDPSDCPEIIVVGTDPELSLAVLEGHARISAAIRRERTGLHALVGISPWMSEWKYY